MHLHLLSLVGDALPSLTFSKEEIEAELLFMCEKLKASITQKIVKAIVVSITRIST